MGKIKRNFKHQCIYKHFISIKFTLKRWLKSNTLLHTKWKMCFFVVKSILTGYKTTNNVISPHSFDKYMFIICQFGFTYLHHSCHTDKETSRRFLNQWHTPRTTAGSQTSPSSFPSQAEPPFSAFHLQAAPQDPAPQKEQLVWPLMGSSSPLYSAQSSPSWDHFGGPNLFDFTTWDVCVDVWLPNLRQIQNMCWQSVWRWAANKVTWK